MDKISEVADSTVTVEKIKMDSWNEACYTIAKILRNIPYADPVAKQVAIECAEIAETYIKQYQSANQVSN